MARATALLAVGVLLASAGAGFAAWSYDYAASVKDALTSASVSVDLANVRVEQAKKERDERLERQRKETEARQAAEALAQAQAVQDAMYASLGFEPVGQGVYFRWASSDEYWCGYWDCIGFQVIAADGCPSSLYLEAAILSGGMQVGWTNTRFSGLAPGGSAGGLFEMVGVSGDTFSLTDVSCY